MGGRRDIEKDEDDEKKRLDQNTNASNGSQPHAASDEQTKTKGDMGMNQKCCGGSARSQEEVSCVSCKVYRIFNLYKP